MQAGAGDGRWVSLLIVFDAWGVRAGSPALSVAVCVCHTVASRMCKQRSEASCFIIGADVLCVCVRDCLTNELSVFLYFLSSPRVASTAELLQRRARPMSIRVCVSLLTYASSASIIK
eukprot:857199-Pleurochrysis_carterae.AAC.1